MGGVLFKGIMLEVIFLIPQWERTLHSIYNVSTMYP